MGTYSPDYMVFYAGYVLTENIDTTTVSNTLATTTDPLTDTTDDNTSPIAGLIVGVILAMILIATCSFFLVYCLTRHFRKKGKQSLRAKVSGTNPQRHSLIGTDEIRYEPTQFQGYGIWGGRERGREGGGRERREGREEKEKGREKKERGREKKERGRKERGEGGEGGERGKRGREERVNLIVSYIYP